MNRMPNFMIIGAAKAGTTSLFEILKKHNQVFLPFVKEPMFFSSDENFDRGKKWYLDTFYRGSEGYIARGEGTPHYLYWSEKTAPRIASAYQKEPVKFIVILRDPVSRAYSWYGNMLKDGTENLSFELALQAEDERLMSNHELLYKSGSMKYGYYRGGCYASLLEPFLEFFPKENFLFLLQQDLITDFSDTCRKLTSFLGLDPEQSLHPINSNWAATPRRKWLHYWLRGRSPVKEQFKRLLPFKARYRLKQWVMNSNLKPAKLPELDKQLETQLRQRYQQEILKLSDLINRDLTQWLL